MNDEDDAIRADNIGPPTAQACDNIASCDPLVFPTPHLPRGRSGYVGTSNWGRIVSRALAD